MHIYARGRHGAYAHMYDEIMLPYAGIIRIRFMGMISASVSRAPLQIFLQRYTENPNIRSKLSLN